jgi:hypothetical protein
MVVGEAITDSHRVSFDTLRVLAGGVGSRFERRGGGLFGTFHRFGG